MEKMKILVPTDFSGNAQNALRYALLLSEDQGGALELINVILPSYHLVETPMVVPSVGHTLHASAKAACKKIIQETLLQVQTSHQLNSLPAVESVVVEGPPIAIIRDHAKENQVDLIVLGTKGEHNRLDQFLGSVSSGLMKDASTPVLVIPEHVTYKPVEKITIALDLKESDTWEIFKATDLIGKNLKEVNLLHVYPDGKQPKTEISFEELKYFYQQNKPDFELSFSTLNSNNLNASLNNHVAKNHSDLLVMLGPHMHGFQKWFWQSNTKKMTYQTKVPLLRI